MKEKSQQLFLDVDEMDQIEKWTEKEEKNNISQNVVPKMSYFS